MYLELIAAVCSSPRLVLEAALIEGKCVFNESGGTFVFPLETAAFSSSSFSSG